MAPKNRKSRGGKGPREDLTSPFFSAAVNGDVATFQNELALGRDKDTITMHQKRTAMWHAASNGHLEFVQMLVEKGADMEMVDSRGWSPLMAAFSCFHEEVARYLLEQGANIDRTDNYGCTLLWNGARWGDLELVQMLVEHGADMEKANSDQEDEGRSPLMIACRNNDVDLARYLLEVGANRDTVPLYVAAQFGYLEITQLLMVYGADLNKRTDDGRLPIDVARTEEIKQAIRDEPRRRIDEAPGKRAVEEDQQDQHSNAVASSSSSSSSSSSAHQEEIEVEGEDINNKQPVEVAEGKVAEEDEDSEPSDDEDDRRRRKRAR